MFTSFHPLLCLVSGERGEWGIFTVLFNQPPMSTTNKYTSILLYSRLRRCIDLFFGTLWLSSGMEKEGEEVRVEKRGEKGKERSWIDVFHWSDLGSERGMKGEKWDYECRRKGASGSLSFFFLDSILFHLSHSHSSVREFFLLFLNLQMHLQRASLEVIW